MELPPLRGLHRWLLLPALSAVAGGLAALLQECMPPAKVDVASAVFGAAFGAAAGFATALSGKVWLNLLLSPVLGMVALLPFILDFHFRGIMNMTVWESLHHFFLMMRGAILILTLPLTALQVWRFRRGGVSLLMDVSLAVIMGIAAACLAVWPLAVGGKLELRNVVLLVAYYVGGMLAVDLTFRIAARKASASPR